MRIANTISDSIVDGPGLRLTVFAQGCPQGLAVQEVACGETAYDSQARRMKRTAQVVCQAYLYAVAQPGGLFTDFELRGGIKP